MGVQKIYREFTISKVRSKANVVSIMTKIFVISRYTLFQHGLKQLLQQHPGLTVVGQENEVEPAIDRIKQLEPDTVIFDTSATESFGEDVMQLLVSLPQTLIIGLILQNNRLSIFQAEFGRVKDVSNLVSAVRLSTLRGGDTATLQCNPVMVGTNG